MPSGIYCKCENNYSKLETLAINAILCPGQNTVVFQIEIIIHLKEYNNTID